MVDVTVREVGFEEAMAIVPHLRDADVAEAKAMGAVDVGDLLAHTVRASDAVWLGEADGAPGNLFGVSATSLLGDIGCPWMVGTDVLMRNKRAFMRLSPAYIDEMQRRYRTLTNFVHVRNTAAIRWLGHMGFEFGDEFTAPTTGERFRWFKRERN